MVLIEVTICQTPEISLREILEYTKTAGQLVLPTVQTVYSGK